MIKRPKGAIGYFWHSGIPRKSPPVKQQPFLFMYYISHVYGYREYVH